MTEAVVAIIYAICAQIEVLIFLMYVIIICIGGRNLQLSIVKVFLAVILVFMNLYELPLAIYLGKYYFINIFFLGVLGYLLVKHVKEIRKLLLRRK